MLTTFTNPSSLPYVALNINFTPFPVLTTERLTLRQLNAMDDAGIFALRNNSIVNKYIERPKSITLRQAREFITKINKGITDNEQIYWAIVRQDAPHQLMGTICLWNIAKAEFRAELGYELHPDFYGNGFMQEALANVLTYGFTNMRLRSIEAFTHEENERSSRLLLKNNFRRKADQGKAREKEVAYSLGFMQVS